jgi:hypothetical protein
MRNHKSHFYKSEQRQRWTPSTNRPQEYVPASLLAQAPTTSTPDTRTPSWKPYTTWRRIRQQIHPSRRYIHPGPSRTTQDYPGSSRITQDHPGPSRIFLGNQPQCNRSPQLQSYDVCLAYPHITYARQSHLQLQPALQPKSTLRVQPGG